MANIRAFLAFAVAALCVHVVVADATASTLSDAFALQPWLVATRRDLHRIPELGFEEYKTAQYIRDFLDAHNISYE